MNLGELAAKTVAGLGYELVELERSAGGLLRLTIDHPWVAGQPERALTVDDCEKVTRQMQYVLEAAGAEYRRLEVSSPGVDRLLRDARDFERFVGARVDLTLKAPVGAAGAGQVPANRKRFRGVLQKAEGPEGVPGAVVWQLLWRDEPPAPAKRPGSARGRKAAPAPQTVLGFELAEVREARLAPELDFKGRGNAAGGVGEG